MKLWFRKPLASLLYPSITLLLYRIHILSHLTKRCRNGSFSLFLVIVQNIIIFKHLPSIVCLTVYDAKMGHFVAFPSDHCIEHYYFKGFKVHHIWQYDAQMDNVLFSLYSHCTEYYYCTDLWSSIIRWPSTFYHIRKYDAEMDNFFLFFIQPLYRALSTFHRTYQ